MKLNLKARLLLWCKTSAVLQNIYQYEDGHKNSWTYSNSLSHSNSLSLSNLPYNSLTQFQKLLLQSSYTSLHYQLGPFAESTNIGKWPLLNYDFEGLHCRYPPAEWYLLGFSLAWLLLQYPIPSWLKLSVQSNKPGHGSHQ